MSFPPSVSEAAILQKHKEVDAIMQKMSDSLMRLRLDQRKILTTEQLEILGKDKFVKSDFRPVISKKRYGEK